MSKPRICIIDYGMGNTQSVGNAIEYLGADYLISNRKEDILDSDALILPGVGAFAAAMENLHRLELVDLLTETVVRQGKPFLGICLGMQLLAQDSVELGLHSGLGWLEGHVMAFEPSHDVRIPHVGWNNCHIRKQDPLFHNLAEDAHFYFDHSFHLVCPHELVSATFDYGGHFVASVQRDNIFATQFHPEKSQRQGLKLLRNFLNFARKSVTDAKSC
jgi:glutamine amidotransferase